jgi:hypothetical protein
MYFVQVIYEAERPKTREEQLAYNARSGRLAAGVRDLRATLGTTARRTASFTRRGRGIHIPPAQRVSPWRPSATPQTAAPRTAVAPTAVAQTAVPQTVASGRSPAGRELADSLCGPVQS